VLDISRLRTVRSLHVFGDILVDRRVSGAGNVRCILRLIVVMMLSDDPWRSRTAEIEIDDHTGDKYYRHPG
jgi:hypothetical protein